MSDYTQSYEIAINTMVWNSSGVHKLLLIFISHFIICILRNSPSETYFTFFPSDISGILRYLFRFRHEPINPVIQNVFLSASRKPLTENSMKLMFARVAKRSGVHRLHAHLCRHTFATRFLINGSDVFTLQQILGHSTLEMVRHYVNLASSHIAIQHKKFSPLDRLNLR